MSERRARRRPGENRERLIQAGLYEFGLYGYQGTSTARLATRADVPQPHVYVNFSGKPELFLACLEQALLNVTNADSDAAAIALGELLVFQAVGSSRDREHGASIRKLLDAARDTAGFHLGEILLSAGQRLAQGEPVAHLNS